MLPESLPPGKRMAFGWRRANPLGSLRLLSRHRELLGTAGVYFLSNLAHAALPSVFVIVTAYRYGWSAADVGYVLAAVGICSMIVQAGLVQPVVTRLGEARTLLISLSAGIVAFALYGLAPTGLLFLIGIPIMLIWGMTGPASQGLMSRRVGVDEQGQLQGAASSLRSLTDILGPGLFTLAFARLHPPGRAGSPPRRAVLPIGTVAGGSAGDGLAGGIHAKALGRIFRNQRQTRHCDLVRFPADCCPHRYARNVADVPIVLKNSVVAVDLGFSGPWMRWPRKDARGHLACR